MSDQYILENADSNGYNQAYSEIGDWNEVLKWGADGSIRAGDVVYKLTNVKQPPIKRWVDGVLVDIEASTKCIPTN